MEEKQDNLKLRENQSELFDKHWVLPIRYQIGGEKKTLAVNNKECESCKEGPKNNIQ